MDKETKSTTEELRSLYKHISALLRENCFWVVDGMLLGLTLQIELLNIDQMLAILTITLVFHKKLSTSRPNFFTACRDNLLANNFTDQRVKILLKGLG